MISFFRAPIRNTKPSAQASILQIYKYIISNRASDVTRHLRAITDSNKARRYKAEAFDYVTFSGCFSSRSTNGLIEHSGFLCFDIDKIESEERLLKLKSDLVADEELHTVLCFRSPSGNGLKWVIEAPDRHWLTQPHQPSSDCPNSPINLIQNHRQLYERIRQYLLEKYSITTDHTSDIARPCYLCHDPDAYYDTPTFKDNPASKFLSADRLNNLDCEASSSSIAITNKNNTNQQTVDCRPSTVDKNSKDYENNIEKIVRNIEHRRIDITNAYHDWMLVAMALAGSYGSSGEQYFHRISQFHPKYDNAEAHKMYQSCLRNTTGAVGIGTIVYLMRN